MRGTVLYRASSLILVLEFFIILKQQPMTISHLRIDLYVFNPFVYAISFLSMIEDVVQQKKKEIKMITHVYSAVCCT